METITLNNGVEMPALGLGVFQTPPDETRDAVRSALGAGYRLVDTAAAYGNERQVGEAVHSSELPRSEVFLETKVWISDYGYEETLHAFEKSARKLGVEQIDLLILHQPLPSAFDRTVEAYRALETLLADGKVRAIGVSNFMVVHLTTLLDRATVVPRSTRSSVTPTSSSVRSRTSMPSTTSSRRRGHRSAVSRSIATVATAALSRTLSSGIPHGPTARARHRRCSAGACSTVASSFRSPPSPAASQRTSTCSTSSCPPRRWPQSIPWTPAIAAGPSPTRSRWRRSAARSRRPESRRLTVSATRVLSGRREGEPSLRSSDCVSSIAQAGCGDARRPHRSETRSLADYRRGRLPTRLREADQGLARQRSRAGRIALDRTGHRGARRPKKGEPSATREEAFFLAR